MRGERTLLHSGTHRSVSAHKLRRDKVMDGRSNSEPGRGATCAGSRGIYSTVNTGKPDRRGATVETRFTQRSQSSLRDDAHFHAGFRGINPTATGNSRSARNVRNFALAFCNSDALQIRNLRYSRVQLSATAAPSRRLRRLLLHIRMRRHAIKNFRGFHQRL